MEASQKFEPAVGIRWRRAINPALRLKVKVHLCRKFQYDVNNISY